mmetsp:Transcript_60608/g.177194  ORF Transcript_60608/g.177194 Transcript_60608/m.177194 type:complete len:220 (+) Transcript_60608:250-909(+)
MGPVEEEDAVSPACPSVASFASFAPSPPALARPSAPEGPSSLPCKDFANRTTALLLLAGCLPFALPLPLPLLLSALLTANLTVRGPSQPSGVAWCSLSIATSACSGSAICTSAAESVCRPLLLLSTLHLTTVPCSPKILCNSSSCAPGGRPETKRLSPLAESSSSGWNCSMTLFCTSSGRRASTPIAPLSSDQRSANARSSLDGCTGGSCRSPWAPQHS